MTTADLSPRTVPWSTSPLHAEGAGPSAHPSTCAPCPWPLNLRHPPEKLPSFHHQAIKYHPSSPAKRCQDGQVAEAVSCKRKRGSSNPPQKSLRFNNPMYRQESVRGKANPIRGLIPPCAKYTHLVRCLGLLPPRLCRVSKSRPKRSFWTPSTSCQAPYFLPLSSKPSIREHGQYH